MSHIALHFIAPAIFAKLFFAQEFWRAYFIMIATMAIDVDHVLTTPIYDPLRCSIGFHPLHKLAPIAGYFMLTIFPKTRIIGAGLLIHMALDTIDCQVSSNIWMN